MRETTVEDNMPARPVVDLAEKLRTYEMSPQVWERMKAHLGMTLQRRPIPRREVAADAAALNEMFIAELVERGLLDPADDDGRELALAHLAEQFAELLADQG